MLGMKNEWPDHKIDRLRGIFLEKWKYLGEDDRAWGEYLSKHGIFVMGPRDVRASWNMGRRSVCIENPTFETSGDLMDIVEAGANSPFGRGPYGNILKQEVWYLVPEEFAEKILVLGLP